MNNCAFIIWYWWRSHYCNLLRWTQFSTFRLFKFKLIRIYRTVKMEINDINTFAKLQIGQTEWNIRKSANQTAKKEVKGKPLLPIEMLKRKFTFQPIQKDKYEFEIGIFRWDTVNVSRWEVTFTLDKVSLRNDRTNTFLVLSLNRWCCASKLLYRLICEFLNNSFEPFRLPCF